MKIPSKDFIKNFGGFADTAYISPVVITKNGRECLVLLSIDEYKKLVAARKKSSSELIRPKAMDAPSDRR